MTTEIRRDEWLTELKRLQTLQAQSAGGLTMRELTVKLGVGFVRTRRFLQEMDAQGRLIVTYEQRPSLRRVPVSVPTYRISKAVKGKAA
jgi:hypothetical protein